MLTNFQIEKLRFKPSKFYFRITILPTHTLLIMIVLLIILPGCRAKDSNNLNQMQASCVQDSVRKMATAIVADVTRDGPKAWLHYFTQSPGFFMASGGKLVFPNYDSAAAFVNNFAAGVRSIQLIWSDLNVDPLTQNFAVIRASFHEVITNTSGSIMPVRGYFTGLAEHTSAGWLLRNLHWSIIGPGQ